MTIPKACNSAGNSGGFLQAIVATSRGALQSVRYWNTVAAISSHLETFSSQGSKRRCKKKNITAHEALKHEIWELNEVFVFFFSIWECDTPSNEQLFNGWTEDGQNIWGAHYGSTAEDIRRCKSARQWEFKATLENISIPSPAAADGIRRDCSNSDQLRSQKSQDAMQTHTSTPENSVILHAKANSGLWCHRLGFAL